MQTKTLAEVAVWDRTNSETTNFPVWKRLFDIVFSSFALVITAPVMIIIALTILITDGAPITFKQDRIGKNGELFSIIKFRSMCKNATEILQKNPEIYKKYIENNYKLPEGEDPRITKVGMFLRKVSFDELPQFWNVLKGDMSVVGPRPIVKTELEEYGTHKQSFLVMKPGMTGIWQVGGRSDIGYPERVNIELSYIQKQGLLFDMEIVLQTIYSMIFKRTGAY